MFIRGITFSVEKAWNVYVSRKLEERGDAEFCRASVCGIILWSVVKQHGRSASWRPVRYPQRAAAKHPVVLARVVGAASVLFLSGVQPGRRESLGIPVDMEDSYTVHRRRKAAARRREKTPDPPRRLEDVSDDEDARARMEKMVEDTEKMEELVENVNKDSDKIVLEEDKAKMTQLEDKGAVKKDEGGEASTAKKSSQLVDNASKNSAETRDSDVRVEKENGARSVNPESYGKDTNKEEAKVSRVSDSRKQEGDESVKSLDNVTVSGPAVKMEGRNQNGETRVKRRSKDRSERHSYTTDSSDGEERSMINLRRKKSPEGPKSKVSVGKKPSSRSRIVTDTDDDLNTSRTESSINEKSTRSVKRVSSKHIYSTGTDDDSSPRKNESLNEKGSTEEFQSRRREEREKTRERSAARHRYPSDTDEDMKLMKKSETFPQQSVDKTIIRRSASEMKKQIIPLSDDSLIEDFAKAQEEYLRRERGILDPDPSDVFYKTNKDSSARRRKTSIIHTEPEKEKIVKAVESKRSWFSWLPFFGKKEKIDEPVPDTKIIEKTKKEISNDAKKKSKKANERERVSVMEYFRALRDIVSEFKAFVEQNPKETQKLRKLRNRCVADLILVIIYCGLGAFVFRFTEGAFETFYKCGVKRVKRDFLDSLWNYSHNMREDDWKSMARRKLMEFEEQLHTAHEAGVHSYSGQKNWTFLNAVVYCLTVITTIGYGHISPNTTTGKALTIVYAIFGIPIFLIILADFGKLFTRGIKFLWAFVRRVYYTGSCRKVRRTAPMQEVMKGVQLVYDFATFRRPSQMNPEELEEMQRQQNQAQTVINLDGNMPQPDTPGTPAMSAYAIDDEFNLPISVAISVLLGYIFIGASGYYMWEDWSFFESFYFVFISMSTIGFGDYVPQMVSFKKFISSCHRQSL
ncbi:uncharacterized protein LOC107267266 isoform X2 [Cephus cinctus]|uniref:Uncharacterized protein LOC107267266 isoform X2 n=1 Tax=Cephus cinctus TaxID=211228 RepID=A0AAJ7BV14_CEPCN|nr:uncharacterized protein LOC107267266 isoform X2 [Cephus cinctus]